MPEPRRRESHAGGAARRAALSLVELLVVLAIVALLVGLLLPAVLYSRNSARQATCQNNLRQVAVGMEQFIQVKKRLPNPNSSGVIGGWVIDLLPFIEEVALADSLSGRPLLNVANPQAATRRRPAVLSCPNGYEEDSSVPLVPASHYSAKFMRRSNYLKSDWQFGELPLDSRIPWVASPEVPFGGPHEQRPHGGGYHIAYGTGPQTGAIFFDTQ